MKHSKILGENSRYTVFRVTVILKHTPGVIGGEVGKTIYAHIHTYGQFSPILQLF